MAKEKNETKEIVAKENTPTALISMSEQIKELGISAQDLVIPKILLMQNTSEMVGDGKAKLGDVINSQTLEILGSVDKPISFIPLKLYKTWRVYDMSQGQPSFLRQDAVSATNEKLPWEDVEEVEGKQVPIRRDLCMNFFVLLMSEVEEGTAFPCVVSFKRTSMQAGRQLATHLFKMACLNRLPYSQTQVLKVTRQKQDTNTYAVFEIGKGAELSLAHKEVAATWVANLAQIAYKVDEADETEAPAAAPAAPVVVGGSPDMKF
jgi:hypothetical protein